jgi:hypothetical protein
MPGPEAADSSDLQYYKHVNHSAIIHVLQMEGARNIYDADLMI